jgi:hypothetical protein
MTKKNSKINIVDFNNIDPPAQEEEITPVEPVVMKTPKPRAKAKSKVKAPPGLENELDIVKEEEEVKEEPVKEEPVKEEPVKEEPKKKDNKTHECEKCGKKLTLKGLTYSHKCPFDKIKPNAMPTTQIIERIIERTPPPVKEKEKPDYTNIPEGIIQEEINKRMQTVKQTRLIKRDENIRKLTMNMF